MDIYSAKFSQDKKFYVYEYLRSKKSKYGDIGSPYYVGKGKGNRAFEKHHKGISVPKNKNNIQISSLMNEADSFQSEILKIQLYGRIDLDSGYLRNKTNGGEGISGIYGFIRKPFSKEHKHKLSMSHLGKPSSRKGKPGKPFTAEMKKKMSRPMPLKTKLKISKSLKGKSKGPMSDHQKLKLSIIHSGRIFSEKTKQKMSAASKGKSKSEETKQRMKEAWVIRKQCR